MVRGYTLFGEALAREGVDTGFYIMGGPINDAVKAAVAGATGAAVGPEGSGARDAGGGVSITGGAGGR